MPLLPTRAIFCCDANADYVQFWPVVSKLWREVHGVIPTLIFIGTQPDFERLDTTWGEVRLFEPLVGIPTSFTAQVLRLVAPTAYPDDVCVVSDIDLFLMKPDFFRRYGLASLPDSSFASLNRYTRRIQHISMTYQVAKGSTFREVFGCDGSWGAMRAKLIDWSRAEKPDRFGIPWSTDERTLTKHLQVWRGDWRLINTPGIWGGNGQQWTVTRFNQCKLPARLELIHELEPFHPLMQHLSLVQQVFRVALPEFQWPAPVKPWFMGQAPLGPSRHPQKQVIAVAPGLPRKHRPIPPLQGFALARRRRAQLRRPTSTTLLRRPRRR